MELSLGKCPKRRHLKKNIYKISNSKNSRGCQLFLTCKISPTRSRLQQNIKVRNIIEIMTEAEKASLTIIFNCSPNIRSIDTDINLFENEHDFRQDECFETKNNSTVLVKIPFLKKYQTNLVSNRLWGPDNKDVVIDISIKHGSLKTIKKNIIHHQIVSCPICLDMNGSGDMVFMFDDYMVGCGHSICPQCMFTLSAKILLGKKSTGKFDYNNYGCLRYMNNSYGMYSFLSNIIYKDEIFCPLCKQIVKSVFVLNMHHLKCSIREFSRKYAQILFWGNQTDRLFLEAATSFIYGVEQLAVTDLYIERYIMENSWIFDEYVTPVTLYLNFNETLSEMKLVFKSLQPYLLKLASKNSNDPSNRKYLLFFNQLCHRKGGEPILRPTFIK